MQMKIAHNANTVIYFMFGDRPTQKEVGYM